MMQELGLLDEFLKLPHSKVDHISMQIGADTVKIAIDRPADGVQIHRLHAAVGFSQLPRRPRQEISRLSICACAPRRPM